MAAEIPVKYKITVHPRYDPGVKQYSRYIDAWECKLCKCLLPTCDTYHNCPVRQGELDAIKYYKDRHLMANFKHAIKVMGFKAKIVGHSSG